MLKKYIFLVLLFPTIFYAQTERYPVFDVCKGADIANIKDCFLSTTKKHFFAEFKTPPIVENENYSGVATVLFMVTDQGEFKIIYVNTPYEEVKKEVERAFNVFPKISPARYNNHDIEMKFELPIHFPIEKNTELKKISKNEEPKEDLFAIVEKSRIADSTFLEHNSLLNIPFTHQKYVDYEFAMHKANGTHTASKPYTYSEVNKYFNLTEYKKKFLKPEVKSWVGNKIWNEHLLQVKKKDFWFTLDFLVDVQLGKDNSNVSYTYNNSRILTLNGGLGDKLSYSATVYESQGRFANYLNSYISNRSLLTRPKNSEGLVPGRGKAKGFKEDAFDYPVAEGYLAFQPNKFMQFQFGNGKNFIGDGYRSFVLSDVSSPTTYLKMKVDFWKFQYTNVWMWNTEPSISTVSNPNEHARKYIAAHYLSLNITKKLNIGFFETAISSGEQGFDAGFLNPVIFYRSVEFNRGEDAGNAIIGLTGKYKLNHNISLYSQLVVDEFSVGNLNNLGDWRNKFAYQLGAKYFNAFNIDHLFLQLEYNYARPYTFAHRSPILNYGNYSQPMAHLWGANFYEAVAIARYTKDRWSFNGKLIFGKKGFDFEDEAISYGGNIYQSYDNRFGDTGNELAQGNTAKIFIADFQSSYLLNPSNNLSLFGSFMYRKFAPKEATNAYPQGNTVWFSAGIRADLFNWYKDF
ncbi:gliding motility protein RemB [Polaribacter batillariae]|uniref:Gliding motility protein RemB n=1 Tax=Polaribacter batillariae TaxID=2808900 RepID=A0ABX7SR06_9FLAO|nr:gliding motility protein RemB [Polaribacter batillariae]QTD36566.1 gliding motility protein RemB [Polaribacter batillariae]